MKLADCKIGMIVCLKADAHDQLIEDGGSIGQIVDLALPWACFHNVGYVKPSTSRLLESRPPNAQGYVNLGYRHKDRPQDVVFPVVKFAGGVLTYITDYEDIEPFTAY